MSRIGKKPITIPAGVEVTIAEGNLVTVKGPKGTLVKQLHPAMVINKNADVVTVEMKDESQNALQGLTRTLINNMVIGVTEGFKKELEVNGVGYRAQKKGNDLVMNLGYSHPVEIVAPEGISFDLTDANHITVRGIDKELVGQTAAVIRTKRPPEVYRGKGIKYAEEHIRRKEGKAGKK